MDGKGEGGGGLIKWGGGGGLSPSTFKSGGAQAPLPPPISPSLSADSEVSIFLKHYREVSFIFAIIFLISELSLFLSFPD